MILAEFLQDYVYGNDNEIGYVLCNSPEIIHVVSRDEASDYVLGLSISRVSCDKFFDKATLLFYLKES